MGALLMSEQFLSDLRVKPDADKIEALKTKAKDLVNLRIEHSEALALLRGYNNLIEGPCRDPELVVFIRAAKRGRTTITDLVKPGDRLSMKRLPFLLDGIFTPQDTNLIVGREKKGKTSFVVAWIAAWHFGQGSFCGFDIAGACPPVIVIGPDMTEHQWGGMLHQYHLASADGDLLPDGPIKQLLHMGHDFCLDQHGLDLIDQLGDLHPGALFIFDSYSRLVDPLGLREETAEFAGPLIQAQSILAKRSATGIWLHHSAANRDTGKASSRGSTALPAAADQIVFLEYPTANEDDPRTLLRTKGREVPISALLERTKPDGVWICHANGEELERQRRLQSRIDKIRSVHALAAFQAMQRLYAAHPLGSDLQKIADATDGASVSQLRKPMTSLIALGLVTEHGSGDGGANGGRPAIRYAIPPSVAEHLNLTFQKPPIRPTTETIPTIPQTPPAQGFDDPSAETVIPETPDPSRVQESHKSLSLFQESSADAVSGIVGIVGISGGLGGLLESAPPSTNGHATVATLIPDPDEMPF